jgi:transcriptional regulator with XRE-family HTH domain
MPVKQTDNFFSTVERNIRQQAKASGYTLADLSKGIEMTEAGFHKMLSTESIKLKTLQKLSVFLKQPITFFLQDHYQSTGYQEAAVKAGMLAEPQPEYLSEKENLKEQIKMLKSQLKDKEKIIELLSKKA